MNACSAKGLTRLAGVLAPTLVAMLRAGQERAGPLKTKGSHSPVTRHFLRLRTCPPPPLPVSFSLSFLVTEGRNGKENYAAILRQNRPCRKLHVLGEPHFQQAVFQAAPESL